MPDSSCGDATCTPSSVDCNVFTIIDVSCMFAIIFFFTSERGVLRCPMHSLLKMFLAMKLVTTVLYYQEGKMDEPMVLNKMEFSF